MSILSYLDIKRLINNRLLTININRKSIDSLYRYDEQDKMEYDLCNKLFNNMYLRLTNKQDNTDLEYHHSLKGIVDVSNNNRLITNITSKNFFNNCLKYYFNRMLSNTSVDIVKGKVNQIPLLFDLSMNDDVISNSQYNIIIGFNEEALIKYPLLKQVTIINNNHNLIYPFNNVLLLSNESFTIKHLDDIFDIYIQVR